MPDPDTPGTGTAQCQECGNSVRLEDGFCTQCGTTIVACWQCGQLFQPGTRFCGSCGAPRPVITGASGEDDSVSSPWDLVRQRLRRATLGEYDILREVGRGGMAAVYLAHEIALDRKVAIKVMSPSVLMGHGMAQRFRQEAVTVAALSHQNIVTVYGVRQFEDLQFFVMQFVDGCSLESVLRSHGRLSPGAARAIIYQVGSALAHAHAKGVIHRDVKPGNILIDRSGHAVVTDFGIAKVLEAPGHTQTGVVVGTPSYMSPEQIRNGRVSWASDQYSLGMVAFEVLAGKVPFDGPTMSVLHAQVNDPVPSLAGLAPGCPDVLCQAVERMLAKTPERRFGSMAEALAAAGAGPLVPGDGGLVELAELVAEREALPSVPTTPLSPIPTREAMARTAAAGTAERVAAEVEQLPPTVKVTRMAGKAKPKRRGVMLSLVVMAVMVAIAGALWLAGLEDPSAVANDPAASASLGVPVTGGQTPPGEVNGARAGSEQQQADDGGQAAPVTSADDSLPQSPPLTQPTAGAAGTDQGALVTARVELSRRRLQLPHDGTERLTATALSVAGSPLTRPMAWGSDNPAIATVDEDGTVTAIAPGATQIWARSDSAVAIASIQVMPPPAVAITGSDTLVEVGDRWSVSAELANAAGERVSGQARWLSTDSSVTEVTGRGQASALAPGTAYLIAHIGGQRDSIRVTVARPTEAQLRESVASYLLAINSGDIARVSALFAPGSQEERDRMDKLLEKLERREWQFRADSVPAGWDPVVTGDSAAVRFVSQTRWRNAFGASRDELVTFEAVFSRDDQGRWTMVSSRTAEGTRL